MPTLADNLLSLLASAQKTPAGRWSELSSCFQLALRSERDGALEVGRRVLQAAVADIDRMTSLAVNVAKLTNLSPPPSLDRDAMYDAAKLVRALSIPQAPQTRAAVEQKLLTKAGTLAVVGVPAEDKAAAVAAATDLLLLWEALLTRLVGAVGLLDAVAALPALDAALAPRLAYWMSQATLGTKREERQELQDAALSAAVFARLQNRPLEVPDVVYTGSSVWAGPCDPATVLGATSGPFRTVLAVTDLLTFVTSAGHPDEILTLPETVAKPELVFHLGPTDPNGRYIFPLPVGAYTIRMAANVLPGALLTLNLTADAFGQVGISAADVAGAINGAALPGISANPVPADLMLAVQTVEVTCSDPVSGPNGWVKFHTPSNDQLWRAGFPPLTLTPQVSWSSTVAAALTQLGARARAGGETRTILSGSYASSSQPTKVHLAKGILVPATPVGDRVLLEDSVLSRVAVGDECWCIGPGGPLLTYVVSVEFDGLTLDQPALATLTSVTINPPPPTAAIAGVGFALELGGRWYRFVLGNWAREANTKAAYVALTDHGHYESVAGAQFRVLQDAIRLYSRDDSTASYLQVTGGGFATEAGLPGGVFRGTATRISGLFTAKEGFRSRVRVGDYFSMLNVRRTVTAVADGEITFTPGMMVGNPVTITIRNGALEAWVAALAAWTPPNPDIPAIQALIARLQRGWDDRASTQLVGVLSALVQSLATPRVALASFVARDLAEPATSRMIAALAEPGLERAYDALLRGDLAPFLATSREVSHEGEAADAGSSVATGVNPRLTPLDYSSLMGASSEGSR